METGVNHAFCNVSLTILKAQMMPARFLAAMEHVPFVIKSCLRGKRFVTTMLRTFTCALNLFFFNAKTVLDV